MPVRKTATASFARPANTTAYAAGDIVANHATAGSVVVPPLTVSIVPGKAAKLTRVHLLKSAASVTLAAFRIHFFLAAPVVTSGDNAVMAVAGIAAGYVGKADVTIDRAFSDGSAGDVAVDLPFALNDGSKLLYAVIEARDAYVPASGETFTVKIDVERD